MFYKRQDARIIVGLFYEDQARRVFCEVISHSLISACIILLSRKLLQIQSLLILLQSLQSVNLSKIGPTQYYFVVLIKR